MAFEDLFNNPKAGLAMQMLAQSGYSPTPMTFGQRAGQAGLGHMQQQNEQRHKAMQRKYMQGQLDQVEDNLKESQRVRDMVTKAEKLVKSGDMTQQGFGQMLFGLGVGMGKPQFTKQGAEILWPSMMDKRKPPSGYRWKGQSKTEVEQIPGWINPARYKQTYTVNPDTNELELQLVDVKSLDKTEGGGPPNVRKVTIGDKPLPGAGGRQKATDTIASLQEADKQLDNLKEMVNEHGRGVTGITGQASKVIGFGRRAIGGTASTAPTDFEQKLELVRSNLRGLVDRQRMSDQDWKRLEKLLSGTRALDDPETTLSNYENAQQFLRNKIDSLQSGPKNMITIDGKRYENLGKDEQGNQRIRDPMTKRMGTVGK